MSMGWTDIEALNFLAALPSINGSGLGYSEVDYAFAYHEIRLQNTYDAIEANRQLQATGCATYEECMEDAGRDHIKYYIDTKTFLVRRVSPVKRYGNVVGVAEDMTDYRPVQGIMMPSRTRSDGGTFDLEFAFDVEYDPGIFERKPAIEDGPDGWKPAKK